MLSPLRSEIERKVPVANGGGGDQKNTPDSVTNLLRNSGLAERLEKILDKHPKIRGDKLAGQLGALGGGNHFIEICIDESDSVLGDAAFGLARHRQYHRHLFHRACAQ